MASKGQTLKPLPALSSSRSSSSSIRKAVTSSQLPDPKSRERNLAQQELQNIKDEIRSKSRLVETLNKSLKSAPEQLKEEVFKRDHHIFELNRRILQLQQSKIETETGRMDELEETVMSLTQNLNVVLKEKEDLHEKLLQKDNDVIKVKNEFIDRIENGETNVSTAELALNDAKQETKNCQLELDSAKKDIIQMALMMRTISNLNTQLNEKTIEQNEQIEAQAKEKHTFKVKAASADDLERRLFDNMNENIKLQTKVDKFEAQRMTLATCYNENVEKLKNIENILDASVLEEHHILATQLIDVRHQFKLAWEQPDVYLPQDENQKIEAQYKSKLQEKNIQIGKLRSSEKAYTDRISELEAFVKSLQAQMVEQAAQMKQKLEVHEGKLQQVQQQYQELKQSNNSQGQELNMVNNKLASFTSLASVSRQRLEQKDLRIEQLDEEVIRLRKLLENLRSQTQTKEADLRKREQNLTKMASMANSYEEELSARDKILMEKTAQLAQIQEEQEKLGGKQKLKSVKSQAEFSTVGPKKGRDSNATLDLQSGATDRQLDHSNWSSSSVGTNSRLKGSSTVKNLLGSLQSKKSSSANQRYIPEGNSNYARNKMYLPDIQTSSSMHRSKSTTPSTTGSDKEPLYQLVNNYITRIEEAKRWKNSKHAVLRSHKSYKTSQMSVNELQGILQTTFPDEGDMDPIYALEMAYGNKISDIKQILQNRLGGIQAKLDVKELLQYVRYEKLTAMLLDVSEVNIQELLRILDQCAN